MRSNIIEIQSLHDLTHIRKADVDAVIAPAPSELLELTKELRGLSEKQAQIFVSQLRSNASNIEKLPVDKDTEVNELIKQSSKCTEKLKGLFQMAVSPTEPHKVQVDSRHVGFLSHENKRTQPWHVDLRPAYVMTWASLGNGTSFIDDDLSIKERDDLIQKRSFPLKELKIRTLDNSQVLLSKQMGANDFNYATGLVHRAENLGKTRLATLIGTMPISSI